MPDESRHCKHCGLEVAQIKGLDGLPIWVHFGRDVETGEPLVGRRPWRECMLTFYAEPEGDPTLAQRVPLIAGSWELLMPHFPVEIQQGSPVEVRLNVDDWNARGADAHRNFKRLLPMAFLPHPDEEIDMDEETGLSMTVRSRWWSPTGLSILSLKKVYLDPPEHVHRNMVPAKGVTFWWSDRDGDLYEILNRNDWRDD